MKRVSVLLISLLLLSFSSETRSSISDNRLVVLHEHTFGGTGLDYTSAIITANDGKYVLAGRTDSSRAGSEDMWLIKVNSSGELEFDQTSGGIAADVAYGVVENGNEGYSLAGRTSSFGAGKEDILFIIVGFENETADGFTSSMIITSLVLVMFIRSRLTRSHVRESK